MKWTNSYRSFGLKTKRSTGLKTIEHKHRISGIVVKVTSVTTWNGPGDVPLLDWRHEGLYKPSVARCS